MSEDQAKYNKIRKKVDNNFLQYSKSPPEDVDTEQVVLGAIILEPNSLMLIIDTLKAEMFYEEIHQRIFEAILSLYNDLVPVDILTVTNRLKEQGNLELIGGAYYIAQLTNRVASSVNIEYHTKIIIQKYINRELIRTGSEQAREAYEDSTDVLELLAKSEKNLFSISETIFKKPFRKASDLLSDAQQEIFNAVKNGGKLIGLPTGFKRLDELTGGWQKTDSIIIAGRASMGKSAFMLNLVNYLVCELNYPIALFSLEMSGIQVMNRLISLETNINGNLLKNGRLDDYDCEKIMKHTNRLKQAPLYIDDTPAISLFELRAKARRLKHQFGIKLIVTDYLQLMTPEKGKNLNRELQISGLSQGFKSLAKELDIPTITLSQLSREVERRVDKRPVLADLRESGSIENDCDVAILLYREKYYKKELEKDICEIIVAKHRNGATGTIELEFIAPLTKFVDYEDVFTDNISETKSNLNLD
jgi:replicative DNA helicase